MSSILNIHGVYMLLEYCENAGFRIFTIILFVALQIFYYSMYYFAYKQFGIRYFLQVKSADADLIRKSHSGAFKIYEICKSIFKIDAMLYILGVATYMYDAIHINNNLLTGIILGSISYSILITYTLIGLLSVISTTASSRDEASLSRSANSYSFPRRCEDIHASLSPRI
jgi:hypothetical protein